MANRDFNITEFQAVLDRLERVLLDNPPLEQPPPPTPPSDDNVCLSPDPRAPSPSDTPIFPPLATYPSPVSPASAVNATALKHRRVSLASPSSPLLVQPWMFKDEMGLQPQTPEQSATSSRVDKVPEKKGKMRQIDTSQNSDESSAPAMEKKPRTKWSSEETQMLVNGCQLHGVGNWKTILQDPDLKFHDRSAVDLKDRFRTYFPEAYRKHYPNARTHLSSKIPSTFTDGTSLFEKTRSKRRPFTEAEDRALKAGYEKHGTIWTTIVKDPIFQEQNRRSTDLRDRFRNAFPSLYQAAGYKPRSASKKNVEGPVRADDDQLSMSTAAPVSLEQPPAPPPPSDENVWLSPDSGAPSPSDTPISPPLATYPSSLTGSGSSSSSNVPTTIHGSLQSPPSVPYKPFRCPKPNCNKSYKQANGLKYHMSHGLCSSAPPIDVNDFLEKIQTNITLVGEGSAAPTSTASPTYSSEAELRPFACGVGECRRRYKTMNGLKYHYQHSGDHGTVGLALLASGQHECLGRHGGDHSGGRMNTTITGSGARNMGGSRTPSIPLPQPQQRHYRRDSASSMLSSRSPSPNDFAMGFLNSPLSSGTSPHSSRKNPVISGVAPPARYSLAALRGPVYEESLPTNLPGRAETPVDNFVAKNGSKLSFGRRRRGCESCRRRRMKCDMTLFECPQCQRAGLQCTFGPEPERGRSRYRLRRTQSVPDPPKADVALPDRITIFPPPPPFLLGRPEVHSKNRTTEQQPTSQQAQHNASNNPKTKHEREKFDTRPIIPESPPLVSFGVSRPRSLSFYGPTERDPNFGRPYSLPSSRASSRPSSRLSFVHESPVSTSGLWFQPSAWFQEGSTKGQSSRTQAVKPISRLAIPLPLPPVTIGRRRRANRKRDWWNMGTEHLDSYMAPSTSPSARRTRHRRSPRPPSPHPFSSRASSRSSLSIPLERKSSFSYTSPGPRSASSSRHSSRPSSRSPVRYSPNQSPRTSFYASIPPTFNPQALSRAISSPLPPSRLPRPIKHPGIFKFMPSHLPSPPPPSPPQSIISEKNRIRKGFWNQRGDFLTEDGYIVYAPLDLAYPDELLSHPPAAEGFRNHQGLFMPFTAQPELLASLPRYGNPPERPYNSFVAYQEI